MKKGIVVYLFVLMLYCITGCGNTKTSKIENADIVEEYITVDYNTEYTNEQDGWKALVSLSSDCYDIDEYSFYGETEEEREILEEAYFVNVETILDNCKFQIKIDRDKIIDNLKRDYDYINRMSTIKYYMIDTDDAPDYYYALHQLWQYQFDSEEKISEFDIFFIDMIEKVYPDIFKKGVPYIIENEIGFSSSTVECMTKILKDTNRFNEYQNIMPEVTENDNNKGEMEQKSEPSIGMTSSEVRSSTWGIPNSINKTTTEYGVHEQWVYGNGRYIYLDNGVVTAIQE